MTEPLENVRVGMTGRHELVVTRELTVGAHVEGMPFVFGTPMMILAMETAAVAAAAPHLPDGWATVGSEVNVRHLAPSPVGRTVTATARVVEVSGRSLLLAVEAHDGVRKIGDGTHRRGVVNLESFAKRLAADGDSRQARRVDLGGSGRGGRCTAPGRLICRSRGAAPICYEGAGAQS